MSTPYELLTRFSGFMPKQGFDFGRKAHLSNLIGQIGKIEGDEWNTVGIAAIIGFLVGMFLGIANDKKLPLNIDGEPNQDQSIKTILTPTILVPIILTGSTAFVESLD